MKTGWMDTENSIRTVLLRLGKASNPLICTTEVKIDFELIPPTNADDPGNQNNNKKKELNMGCCFPVYKNQMLPTIVQTN